MTPLHYHEAAETELLDAVGYLELQSRGLGRRFFTEVRRVEHLIGRFPESATQIQPGIRKWALRKFKYAMVYAIEEAGVLVLAVAHDSRRPDYWVRRISSR